jgi:effector-binding domain-containing protein
MGCRRRLDRRPKHGRAQTIRRLENAQGGNEMSELDVQIVRMEPMRVACAHGFGESPEAEAWDKILAFAKSKGLDPERARFFGFNNPNPSPGSPEYGYDQWMTVGPEVEGEGDIVIKEIPSRLYAMARCEGLQNIGEVWKRLVLWFEDSHYKKPAHWCECLEELLTPPDVPFEEYVFNLYLPIAE